jgi:hypothetical protein
MSVPPPPNQWGSQPPTGQPGGVPQWSPPPGPPQRRGGKGKWIFGGIAVLAVMAVTVVITVLVVGKHSSGGESPTPTNGNGSDFASANDKGPVGIITEDPTCTAWKRISNSAVDTETQVRWTDRDQSLPATAWTPEQRSMYETVGKALRNAADQTVGLVKSTPHRVMRELYEQFIAFSRAFADRIPQYSADEKELGTAPDTIASAIGSICSANQRWLCVSLGAVGASRCAPVERRFPGGPSRPAAVADKA